MKRIYVSKYALLITYGAYAQRNRALPSMNHLKTVSVDEVLAHMLFTTNFLPEQRANEEIRKATVYYMPHDTVMTRGKTKADFIVLNKTMDDNDRGDEW